MTADTVLDMVERSSLSLEFYKKPVSKTLNGVEQDPTGDAVYFAFLPRGADPGTSDWVGGEWETDPSGPVYYARILVGPGGGVDPGKGRWVAWWRADDNPERPARIVGTLVLH